MISKLNQKLINIDNESILTKLGTTFYFENSFNSSEKEIPEVVKFNSNTPLTNAELEALGTCYVIPYISIVYIKDTQRFWTHGLIYDGKPPVVHNVSSSSKSFTVDGTTYTLSKEGNDFAITSFTAPVLKLQFVATSGSNNSQTFDFDNLTHSVSATAIPQNKVLYTLDLGSVSNVLITSVSVKVGNNSPMSITGSDYLKTLTVSEESFTDLFTTLPSEAKASAVTAIAEGKVGKSASSETLSQVITILYLDNLGNTYSTSATCSAKKVTATLNIKKHLLYVEASFDSKPTVANLIDTGYTSIPRIDGVNRFDYSCGTNDCWLGYPASWGEATFESPLGVDNSWVKYSTQIYGIDYNCYWHKASNSDTVWKVRLTNSTSF